MRPGTSPLDRISVASPCGESWDDMSGDDRVRFCDRCELNVFNLSGMTRDEAERTVAGAEGRLCVRYFQRSDGMLLTRDCPVGLAARMRRRLRLATAAILGLLTFAWVSCRGSIETEPESRTPEQTAPEIPRGTKHLLGRIRVDEAIMGDWAPRPEEPK